jgi:pyruvate-formate lyase
MADLLERSPPISTVTRTRLMLWNKTPKYGNDDDYADAILKQVFDAFFDEVNGRPNTRGGAYRVNYLSTTCHVYFGSVTGATPTAASLGAALRRHLARPGRRPARPHRGDQIGRQDGPRPHRRHAA